MNCCIYCLKHVSRWRNPAGGKQLTTCTYGMHHELDDRAARTDAGSKQP